MPSQCGTPVFATTARATKVSSCGVPVTGAGNAVVTDGLVSVEINPQQVDGTEAVVTNGAGRLCVAKKTPPQLKWDQVIITLCKVNPEMLALLSGDTLVLDDTTPTPVAVGLQQRRSTYATGRFAFETWTETDGMACATVGSDTLPWLGYSLLPFVVEGVMGNIKFEQGAASAVINARTENGTAWGVGPWNVINTSLGVASKLLLPLPTDTHHHFQWTTLAVPTAACSAIAVP